MKLLRSSSSNNGPTPIPSKDSVKKIKNYLISFGENELIGRNKFGEVRLGYQMSDKNVLAFRISSLPISNQLNNRLQLQKYYSELSCCAKIVENVESHSNYYTVIEYFPQNFYTSLPTFRRLTKNLYPLFLQFLQAYSVLYYLRISHGNLSLHNIGITYDNKVKLMDFKESSLSLEEAAAKDYEDFRKLMCVILERDKIFPNKMEVFDDSDGNWIKLFSVWHVVNPYRSLFIQKTNWLQNSTVLLSKLSNNFVLRLEKITNSQLNQQNHQNLLILQIAISLLIQSNIKKLRKDCLKTLQNNKQTSKNIQNMSQYNSLIWSCIKDAQYFEINQIERVTLILCMLPFINHEYFYVEVSKQLQIKNEQFIQLRYLGDSLIKNYSHIMLQNMIQQ